jgi:hypothetical protein
MVVPKYAGVDTGKVADGIEVGLGVIVGRFVFQGVMVESIVGVREKIGSGVTVEGIKAASIVLDDSAVEERDTSAPGAAQPDNKSVVILNMVMRTNNLFFISCPAAKRDYS